MFSSDDFNCNWTTTISMTYHVPVPVSHTVYTSYTSSLSSLSPLQKTWFTAIGVIVVSCIVITECNCGNGGGIRRRIAHYHLFHLLLLSLYYSHPSSYPPLEQPIVVLVLVMIHITAVCHHHRHHHSHKPHYFPRIPPNRQNTITDRT